VHPSNKFFLVAIAFVAVSLDATTYVVPKDETMVSKASAIVIGSALGSHTEELPGGELETITTFAVEEVLKGNRALIDGVRVHSPGGAMGSRLEAIPGAPRFRDGKRVLLFLTKVGQDDYATTDLGLGSFHFAFDSLGHAIVTRDEISGWNLNGSIHEEPLRDADRFVRFIRDAAAGRPVSSDYTIASAAPESRRHIISDSTYTVTNYTFASDNSNENSLGTRWMTFPNAVIWNRGNAEINASNSGSDAINAAFASWNNEVSSNVNYVLTTSTANSNGIFDPLDGINNVVFEKDMTFRGVSAYDCSTGGVLGSGGVHIAVVDPSNVLNGESFYKTSEVDISMNQGVGACLPGGAGTLSVGNYISVVTHESGHTLSLRHSDKSRDNTQACTNFPAYDCSNSAIMNHTLIAGLNGVLTPWDQRAVEAVYPAPAIPAGLAATPASSSSVSLTWTASTGALSYTIYRSANGTTYSNVGTSAANQFTDSTASPNTAYLYKVRAVISGVESGDSNRDLATTIIFTDAQLSATTTAIKATHIAELRTAVNAVRRLANNGSANDFPYSDSPVTPQQTQIRRVHITELRTALDAARSSLGLVALTYTDPALPAQTQVKAVHITELRNGVR